MADLEKRVAENRKKIAEAIQVLIDDEAIIPVMTVDELIGFLKGEATESPDVKVKRVFKEVFEALSTIDNDRAASITRALAAYYNHSELTVRTVW